MWVKQSKVLVVLYHDDDEDDDLFYFFYSDFLLHFVCYQFSSRRYFTFYKETANIKSPDFEKDVF